MPGKSKPPSLKIYNYSNGRIQLQHQTSSPKIIRTSKHSNLPKMPRIAFEGRILDPSSPEFKQIVTMMKDDGAPISLEVPIEDVTNDSEILVLLKEFKIGDNHEPWIKGDAEVSVTFQISTGTQERQVTVSKVLGTFREVKKNSILPPTDVLLLPRTKVQDHLSINVDAVELDEPEYARISKLLELINNVVQKVPIPGIGSAASIINNLAGAIVNLISALDDDDVIMREVYSRFIDETTYGENFKEKYLKTGLHLLEEKLDDRTRELLAHTNQKKIEEVERTKVILQVVKRPNIANRS